MENPARHFLNLAAPGVRSLRPYEPGKPVSELERELGLRDVVKLASNENPLGPSPAAVAAAQSALPGIARYPDGNGFALKAALAQRHGVAMNQLTLGNGSNDVLELVARAFLTTEHEALFSAHAFAVYPIVTRAVGAAARIAPATNGSNGPAFGHDLDAMRRLVGPATRVVFIANPNNPTGTRLTADALRTFIADLPDQVIVVLDEAYFEYAHLPQETDAIDWIDEFPNLVVTRTFSKAYGLAGLRVGYSVSRPEVSDLLNRVRQPFNVNLVAEAAALAALDDGEHLERSVAMNRAGMVWLTEAFTRLGLAFIPSAGNFVCVDVGRPAEAVNKALLQSGVIVRPVANYGLPHHLRVTVGTARENERFVAALALALQETPCQ